MANESDTIRVRATDGERVWELSRLETSPCTLACPTRINARGYVSLVSDGRFAEALALIRDRNPFPGVCGRVCPRPCEAACTRGRFDEPIAICALKRFVFDLEMKRGKDPASPARIHRAERVAVIGAGPAGLSAARELALLGYPVTVFEAREIPGGLMNVIPEFRLPREVVRREARAILDMGIELVTGTKFGVDLTWRELKRRGYRALLLGTGAWRPAWKWGTAGVKGVVHAIDFLEHAALDVEDARVVVAGDGDAALDCARAAVRLGGRSATLIVGRSRTLAPYRAEDIAQAEAEGVKMVFLARPSRLEVRGRKLVGVRYVKLLERPADATGRRDVVEISGSEFAGEADLFIDAYGRSIDVKGFAKELALEVTRAGTVDIDSRTACAGREGVFAAGDLVTGPRSVVEAIASGQKAAYGIHRFLSGEVMRSPFDLAIDEGIAGREFVLDVEPARAARAPMPLEEPKKRRSNFNEVERGYSAQAARREGARCLRCGPCGECEVCVDVCEKKDVVLRVDDGLTVDVHAGREFWSIAPERVVLEIGDGSVEAHALRTICRVREELCVGCGRCQEICGYRAVQVESRPGGRFIAHVDSLACKGCGACVAACPTGALDQSNFGSASLAKRLEGVIPGRTKVLFVCHWARPARLDPPEDVLAVEMMCLGRMELGLLVEAVLRGSPRVLVAGCREEHCHYGFGRRNGTRAVERSRALLRLFGFDPEIVEEISTGREDLNLAVNAWAWRLK